MERCCGVNLLLLPLLHAVVEAKRGSSFSLELLPLISGSSSITNTLPELAAKSKSKANNYCCPLQDDSTYNTLL